MSLEMISLEIIDEIESGVLSPGQELAEAELAEAFGCTEDDAVFVLEVVHGGGHTERARDGFRVADTKRRGRRPAKRSA
jgi:hypothetical protein